MQTLVSAWVDDRLTGLARWYTERHIQGCRRCQSSLPFLRAMRARLRHLGAPPAEAALAPERWAQVEAEWERAERTLSPTEHG